MKLGVVPDAEQAPDSPDTALHVEPRVGAQTRTKGHLFLLVTSRVPGPRARDATALVADSIRSEYYYDESAGIRVCLVKAIQVANKRLTHARERGALGNTQGPIGVGLAVVRDNELYVCTVGPAEAYLSRGARLSRMPDPSPIPLADTVAGGFAAAQSSARWARGAVGRALYRFLLRIQDALPSRGVPRRRVTPLSARREGQRRAAVALLSMVVVVGGL